MQENEDSTNISHTNQLQYNMSQNSGEVNNYAYLPMVAIIETQTLCNWSIAIGRKNITAGWI